MFGGTGAPGAFGSTPAFGAAQPAGSVFGGFGGFGQQQQPAQAASPFGGTAAPAFGASATATPAFGAQPTTSAFGAPAASPFGATTTTPAFGAASTPAFGTGAFGAATAPTSAAFGGFGTASTFGAASQSGFGLGATATPAFGATSTPAFGASSAPAFGATTAPAFGAPSASPFGATATPAASPFGGTTSTFGAQPATQSAFGAGGGLFGATSTPSAFGAPAATPAAPGVFGGGASAFGAAATASGSRAVAYTKTPDKDGAAGAAIFYMTLTAMPQLVAKSQEELRFEDYQQNVKNASAAPAPAAATPTAGAFGTTATPGGFGLGTTTTFGAASTPAFGAASTPAFGAGGTGLFGSTQTATPAFGSTTTSAFGTPAATTNPFGTPATTSTFGAASAPAFGTSAFGAASTPSVFGAASTAARPAGGAFSFASTPATTFGAASAPAFGASAFGASSAPSLFGQSSSPATGTGLFGSTTANPLAPNTAASPFGTAFGAKPATPAFGTTTFGASSAPAFGAGGSLFGQTGTSAFGQTTTSAFGASSAPSLFGSSSPSLFGTSTTPSAFGQQQPQQQAFGATTTAPFGQGVFGQQGLFGQQQAAAQPAAQPPSVTSAPYGAFPSLPAVPEPKTGISSRPVKPPSAGLTGRASPLVSLRATATGTPGKIGAFTGPASRGVSISPLGTLGNPLMDSTGSMSVGTTPGSMAGSGTPGMLRPRPNPHQLFIREPPPSTAAAANGSAFSPAQTTPQTAARPASPQQNGYSNGAATPHNTFPMGSPGGRSGASTPDTALTRGREQSGSAGPSGTAGAGAAGAAAANSAAAGDGAVHTPPSGRRAQATPVQDEDYSYLPSLGRLAAQGYSYEPSSSQLKALYERDPDALSKVSNFTVEREGVGRIRWEHPVDVRGLKLDEIVGIEHGEVACYTGDVRPAVGEELNQEAEITLFGVYKMDSNGQPVRDGPAVIKWEKSLRAMCNRMGSVFLSYRPAGGVWKFRVEHFSKYGLMDLDDEDDEDEIQPAPLDLQPAQQARGLGGVLATRGGVGEEDAGRAAERGMRAEGATSPAQATGLRARPPTRPSAIMNTHLQQAMPMLSNNPHQIMAMRDTFEDDLMLATTPSAGLFFAQQTPVPDVTMEPASPGAPQSPPAAPAPASTSKGPSTTTWRASAPAVRTVRPLPVEAARRDADMTMAVTSLDPGQVLSPDRAGQTGAVVHHHQDAGLSLGLSFRVGWGPNGKLIIPGPRTASGSHPILVKRALVEGRGSGYGSDGDMDSMDTGESQGVSAGLAATRLRLRVMLETHMKHSRPAGYGDLALADEPTEGPLLPQWQLQCEDKGMPKMVREFQKASGVMADNAESGATAGELQALGHMTADDEWVRDIKHETETWDLVQVLFEKEPELTVANTPDQDDLNTLVPTLQHTTVRLLKQAGFSNWLVRQVSPEVFSMLRTVRPGEVSPWKAILLFLSIYSLPAAQAVALKARSPRLATLLASAGQRAVLQAQAQAQLAQWQANGFDRHMHPEEVLIYRVLAGDVNEVIDHLGLDWQRALGMHLWYGAQPADCLQPAAVVDDPLQAPPVPEGLGSMPPTRNEEYALNIALHGYVSSLHAPNAPWPLPPHMRQQPPSSGHGMQTEPVDLQYQLLELWNDWDQQPQPQPVPAKLLAASSHSGNALSAALPWALMTVLQSQGVLERVTDADVTQVGAEHVDGGDAWSRWEAVLAGHVALITQLLLAGGLSEWAVYVALHLPDDLTSGRLRHSVVRAVLGLTAPEWTKAPEKGAFLRNKLQIPEELLSEAAAAYATTCAEWSEALKQHQAAGQWAAAHDVLVKHLAPALMSNNNTGNLSAHLQVLAPYADSCPGWSVGGGLYLHYLSVVASGSPTAAVPVSELQQLVDELRAARELASAQLSTQAVIKLGGDSGDVLTQLLAMDLMIKKVQEVLLQVLAQDVLRGGDPGSILDNGVLQAAFGGHESTRAAVLNATAVWKTTTLLAAR